jgi:EmrB/QacA subfamily drug resistance transporter
LGIGRVDNCMKRNWVILALVCGAQFMVVLDIAVVNVALPAIQDDLGVDPGDLQWVVTTYGLLLGGLLLLGGRAADLLGRRKVLVAGLVLFTAASLAAGLADSLGLLIAARAVQGAGGALTAPAALSILASTFAEGAERNKALGIFGAVGGSAASVGVIVSGALTSGPGWPWIFLVNVPIGVVLVTAILRFVPAVAPAAAAARRRFDVLGAATVTAGLMAVVYGIHQSVDHGWTSAATLGFLAAGAALLALFVTVEARTRQPLLPLAMFRRPTLNAANLVAALTFGSFFATIFQASLFMQEVLGYSAIRTGVAYLAIAATAFVVAGAVAARVVDRRGAGTALVIGQVGVAAGLLLLTRVPVGAGYWVDVFPGFLLIGIGIGFSGMAAQVAAFIGVPNTVAGLAGGMVETAREIGGALGIALVGTVALARADDVAAGGAAPAEALAEGFQRGALLAAGFSVAAAIVAALVLRPAERRASLSGPQPEDRPAADLVVAVDPVDPRPVEAA